MSASLPPAAQHRPTAARYGLGPGRPRMVAGTRRTAAPSTETPCRTRDRSSSEHRRELRVRPHPPKGGAAARMSTAAISLCRVHSIRRRPFRRRDRRVRSSTEHPGEVLDTVVTFLDRSSGRSEHGCKRSRQPCRGVPTTRRVPWWFSVSEPLSKQKLPPAGSGLSARGLLVSRYARFERRTPPELPVHRSAHACEVTD